MRKHRRRTDRSGPAPLFSPGRPPVAGRDARRRFWAVIAAGVRSEDAAIEVGVSQAVGARWFRKAGGICARRLDDTVYLINSTGLWLDRRSEPSTRFSDAACGAKVHVIYDPDSDQPSMPWSARRIQRHHPGRGLPIEPGATYVFDLGYYDYGWWAKLDRAQCRIVTRFKSNTPLASVQELPCPREPPSSPIAWPSAATVTSRSNLPHGKCFRSP